ncbi:hypothetical protein F4677DRAFT_314977 [Hypoxylon crocopeplum]|nr:hypothetical protein F4677DRAFT_314977 [Hypoxylon crocopeplum]
MHTPTRTQPSPGIMALLTPTIFLIAALSGSYLFSLRTRGSRSRDLERSTRSRELDFDPEEDDDIVARAEQQQLAYDSGDDDDYLLVLNGLQFRTHFGVRSGAAVRGYPSNGGMFVLHCTAVELDFLELDRFHIAMRSPDQEDEDAHCFNMRKLGATWWESEEAYLRKAMDPNKYYDPVVFVGWPAGGGAWVLRTTHGDASERGVGRINNAYNMEERCRIIRQMGGTYYENPREGLDLDV